jgi:hypothetical protein
MLVQPVLADSSDQANLRHAVDTARLSLNETAQRMNLLVAELDAETLETLPTAAETEAVANEPQAEAPVTPSEPPPIRGTVERALFTSAIEGREPVDELQQIDTNQAQLVFFSELMGFEGQEIWHRWIYQNEVMAEVVFQVSGPRWRVHSSKNLMPDWTGTWQVDVVDGYGRVLASQVLEVVAPVTYEEAAPSNP